jgi:isopenicillin N synthase-like dioxygenase
MWEILMQGLGHAPSVLEKFGQRPMVMMKLIRYPPSSQTLPDQFGIGAHTDFGGITILLQQPGREGLEVWHDKAEKWVPVPAVEDVLVVNCGNIVQKWTNGAYKSAWHRVVNKSDAERKSCAVFWHGDAKATNPLSDDPDQETVGQLLVKRFRNQYSLSKEVYN